MPGGSRRSEIDLVRAIEKQMPYKVRALKRVVLDEEYFDWLKKNGLKEEQQQRYRYMTEVSLSDAERLWNKHFESTYSTITVLPIHFFSMKGLLPSNYKISKDMVKKLKDLLSKHYKLQKKSIFINGELLRGDCCTEDYLESNFVNRADLYFETGEVRSHFQPFLALQKYCNFNVRFLPIALQISERALITIEDMLWEENLDEDLPPKLLVKWLEELKGGLGIDGEVMADSPLIPMDVEEYTKLITNELEKKVNKG